MWSSATHQIFKQSLELFGFILKTECDSLSHFEWRTDDPPPHDGTHIFNQDPPVHLIHQCLSIKYTISHPSKCVSRNLYVCFGCQSYLIWRAVHSAKLFKVLFNGCLNVLIGLGVLQPLPLHQLIKEWLDSCQKNNQLKPWEPHHVGWMGMCACLSPWCVQTVYQRELALTGWQFVQERNELAERRLHCREGHTDDSVPQNSYTVQNSITTVIQLHHLHFLKIKTKIRSIINIFLYTYIICLCM